MEFRVIYKFIDNDHGGYCSGNECDEEDITETYNKHARTDLVILDSFHAKLDPGTVIFKGDEHFDSISEICNEVEDTRYSGWCRNNSERFGKHTRNKIVDVAVFIRYVENF